LPRSCAGSKRKSGIAAVTDLLKARCVDVNVITDGSSIFPLESSGYFGDAPLSN